MRNYTINKHIHNFAVWTAARASQRGFTSTVNIKLAIEKSALQTFVESKSSYSEKQFEMLHRKSCKLIMSSLDKSLPGKTSYGRAAKIIAIYLKTAVIIPNKGACDKSKIIHPPLDKILLTNLSNDIKDFLIIYSPWTLLSEKSYWGLVSKIKSSGKPFDWTLEKYWFV